MSGQLPLTRRRWDGRVVSRVLPFPRRVSVEVTNHCNQRCTACPRQGFSRPLGFMDAGLFGRLMNECAAGGATVWMHFLGEPLLHPGLLDMIRVARQAGVPTVGLSTNAVSLKGALAEGLLDSGLDRLECSMDADDRAHYLAMRGRDHFERVHDNVRAFLRRKRERGLQRPLTSLQYLRTPVLEARLDDIVGRWRTLLGAEDFVMTIDPVSFGGAVDLDGLRASTHAEAPGRRPPCPWLFESVVVLQDGAVAMCGTDWDGTAPLGHLRDASLGEIWNGDEARRRRGLHLDGRFDRLPICAGCEDWRLADGAGYRNASRELEHRRGADAGLTAGGPAANKRRTVAAR